MLKVYGYRGGRIGEGMDTGRELAAELHALDTGCVTRRMRAPAVAAMTGGLRALLGRDPVVVERRCGADSSGPLAFAVAGSQGCVAGVAVPAGSQHADVTYSVHERAAATLVARLDSDVVLATGPVPPGHADRVSALLDSIEAAASTAARAAAERLHDGPVQELTVAQLLIETAATQNGHADGALLGRGVETLREALASTRTLMGELLGDPADVDP